MNDHEAYLTLTSYLRSDFDVDKIRANDHIGWHNTHANWDPLWILYHLANPV